MTDPAFRKILLGGLPAQMRESVVPLGGFVIGSAVAGLGAGIALSGAVSVLVYLHERRSSRDALLIRLALVFVAVQAAIGLVAHNATAYLAQPVLFNAAWGLAFLGSAAVRRPLAGTLACAWYPFPARTEPPTSSSGSLASNRLSGACIWWRGACCGSSFCSPLRSAASWPSSS
jgi:hypothetical protein